MMRVSIIDYGSGNLNSAGKAFERAAREADLDVKVDVTSSARDVRDADRIVLPGVGAFADCRRGLDSIPDLVETLHQTVRQKGRPFLGICVGTQLMATRGLEKAIAPGLDWISGDVVEIKPDDPELKIPQIGWNTLDVRSPHELLRDIPTGPDGWHAYFVHSYHIATNDEQDVIATTQYGGPVTAIVGRQNWVGTQFHPEKSQKLGLKLIANFLQWKP